MELKAKITGRQYKDYLETQKEPSLDPVHKDTVSFIWENEHYSIESYTLKGELINCVRINTLEDTEQMIFPPFLNIGEDVTENETYFMINIAKPHASD